MLFSYNWMGLIFCYQARYKYLLLFITPMLWILSNTSTLTSTSSWKTHYISECDPLLRTLLWKPNWLSRIISELQRYMPIGYQLVKIKVSCLNCQGKCLSQKRLFSMTIQGIKHYRKLMLLCICFLNVRFTLLLVFCVQRFW